MKNVDPGSLVEFFQHFLHQQQETFLRIDCIKVLQYVKRDLYLNLSHMLIFFNPVAHIINVSRNDNRLLDPHDIYH